MKKQTKTKWDFIKTTVVELTSKNLLSIRGGLDYTHDAITGDIATGTGSNNSNGNGGNGGNGGIR